MVAPHTGPNGHHAGSDVREGDEAQCRTQTHAPASGPHPLEPLLANLTELQTHVNHYVQATADGLRLTARQLALKAALGVLGLVVGVAMLVTAAVLALQGAAGGIAAALGGRIWAGQLITGLTLLLLVAVAAWWLTSSMTKSSRRKTLEKYERQHEYEQARLAARERRQTV
jgi:hypothetical protein